MAYLPDPSIKLEPFLLISKSARGAAAAKLIQDATAAPGVLVFRELMEVPSIREVFRILLMPYNQVFYV